MVAVGSFLIGFGLFGGFFINALDSTVGRLVTTIVAVCLVIVGLSFRRRMDRYD